MTSLTVQRERGSRNNAEERLQSGIVELLRLSADPNCIWYAVPNGEKRSIATGRRLKAMGVVAGIPDMAFVLPNGFAAFIEFKSEKGVLSQAQSAFRDKCIRTGVAYCCVSTFDQAVAALTAWRVLKGVKS